MADTNSSESRVRAEGLPPLGYGKREHYKDILFRKDQKEAIRRTSATRRSDVELYMDILDAVNGSSTITRVMYLSNLSWKPMNERIDFLNRAGFIRIEAPVQNVDSRSKEFLYLTPKGEAVLANWLMVMESIYSAMRGLVSK